MNSRLIRVSPEMERFIHNYQNELNKRLLSSGKRPLSVSKTTSVLAKEMSIKLGAKQKKEVLRFDFDFSV